MNETPNTHTCEHESQLIAYLYRELSPADAHSYAAHLAACAACQAEHAGLQAVRGDLQIAREQMLTFSLADSPAFQQALQHAREEHTQSAKHLSTAAPPRTAGAALREFFTLCPLWLRTGGAFAAVACAVLMTLALLNAEVRWTANELAFSTGLNVKPSTAQPLPTVAPTEAELKTLVDARVAAELARLENQARPGEVAATKPDDGNQATINDEVNNRAFAVTVSDVKPRSAAPSKSRRQTKRPARPTPTPDSDTVAPRLYDLLADAG